jgi:hypothetical protein
MLAINEGVRRTLEFLDSRSHFPNGAYKVEVGCYLGKNVLEANIRSQKAPFSKLERMEVPTQREVVEIGSPHVTKSSTSQVMKGGDPPSS